MSKNELPVPITNDQSTVSATSKRSYKFPVDSFFEDGICLATSIGGGPFRDFLVDTGSTGIVVGSQHVGPYVCKTDKNFHFIYSSSKNEYEGIWVVACVTFQSAISNVAMNEATETATTRPMMIRMVERWKPGHSGQWINGSNVAMLGVGFDRDESPDPSSTPPDINPFLLLKEMCAGTMMPGYILTTTSIELGITKENSQGFEFVQLLSPTGQDQTDWAAPMVNVSVPTAKIDFDAILLIDTGLDYCIVQAPPGLDPPMNKNTQHVDYGQRMRIATLNPHVTIYHFDVGDTKTGVAPKYVRWGHNLHKGGFAFVNTSRHALSQIDYLYDAKAGHLGFRFHNGGGCSVAAP